jgi:hypothetical protein
VSGVLLILGTVLAGKGYSQIGSENWNAMQEDSDNFKISYVVPLISMVVGAIVLVTAILGFFTAMCRNSGVNCLFATPFIILAFIGVISLFILAGITSGANGGVMHAKDNACAYDMGNGTMLADYVRE